MTKALAAFLAAALLALAAVGVVARQQAVQIGKLREANATAEQALARAAKQRKLDASTIAAWQAKNAATTRETAAARTALQKALQAAPAWAEADVPPEVQKALQRPAEALQ